ncbi:MAG: autotransporter outer membrane beta-barrel domain-containing protein [Dechloromonas sp.]|nr:autotransporter outer membrane beta-barrel domain-containing protein [Candidatus Dechloromonas phosphoritropha]
MIRGGHCRQHDRRWKERRRVTGYAGTATSSTGSPGTTIWALRARVEWEALADPAAPQLNPYGELSYARANMNGYTETGGGFPVAYNSRTDNVTDLRIGVNGTYPLDMGKKTRLLGAVEGVHRFQDNASNVNGELLGPGGFNFSFAGTSYDQTWMRASIGAETMLGNGKAVVMVNGATRGESPNVWLNARYQLAF